MRVLEDRLETEFQPLLRIYCGDDADEAADMTELDHDRLMQRLDAEVEEFWAGRKLAARLSTRVAA